MRGKTSRRLGITLGVGTVVAMLAAGCSPPGGAEETSGGSSGGPIKIAVINAQSGQVSATGQWELKGVKLAVEEANDAGGVRGRKIELSVLDDQGDPTVATNLARKVGSEGYIAVFGSATSGPTLAMAPVLAKQKIPAITSGQSPKLAALKNPYLFLNGPTSVTYDETLAKYVIGTAGLKNIAIVTNNGPYGAGERAAFNTALQDNKLKAVADQVVTPDQKDFSSALTSIRQKNPDALFIGAEEVQSGLITKQARALGIKATIIGGAPLGTDVYLKTAGTTEAEGTIISTPYPSNDENEATQKFSKAYKDAYGEDAELHGAKAYDGAKIIIEALEKSNVASGRKLADAIRSINYDGLLGNFTFDENGVGIQETRIAIIKGGEVEAVKS